jgi:peroxiredoxin
MLQAGQSAPGLVADADMEMVSLNGFRNRNNVVLYFYPETILQAVPQGAIDFTDQQDNFNRLNTSCSV